MLNRTSDGVVTAASGKHFDVKDYVWHKYNYDRGVKLVDGRGRSVKIRSGDLFGVKEATRQYDRVLVLSMPDVCFKVEIPRSERIMERSKEYRGKVKLPSAETPIKKTRKVKINLADVEDEVKPKQTKPSKPVQPHIEAKKIQKKVEQRVAKPNTKKQQKIKIDLQHPEDIDDEVPHGHVRHGGRLITPDELEFDDDLSGLDLPIPKHYRSLSSVPVYCVALDPNHDFSRVHMIFVTDDLEGAKEKHAHPRYKGSALFQLTITPRRIFDLRKPQCKEDYEVIRDSNPELRLPKLSDPQFLYPHTGVPRTDRVGDLRDALVDLGYDSMYVVETAKGNEMAIFQPHVISGKIKL